MAKKKNKEIVRKIISVVSVIGFLLCTAVLLYPVISDRWNRYRDMKLITEYNRTIENTSEDDKADIECIDWREDELSYNFQIWAYFFSLQDIYYAMWYDIPEKILFEWYDEAINEKIRINLKNFYLMKRKE